MYARDVRDRQLTFRVSGKLWEGSLVMVDDQTSSEWSHLFGEAMLGPLKGTSLEVIPSLLTDWGTWKRRQPETSVIFMPRSAENFATNIEPIHGALSLGLVLEGNARTWAFEALEHQPVVNDDLHGTAVVVMFDAPSRTASVFDRQLDERTLDFTWREGQVWDAQTQTRWDAITGRGLEGPLADRQLRRLPGIVSEPAVWSMYHSGSSTWLGELADRQPELDAREPEPDERQPDPDARPPEPDEHRAEPDQRQE